MTEWAAEQYDEQDSKGTLEVGKLADLVILSQDPLKVDPMMIKDIEVVETIKEGTTIYPAPVDAKAPVAAASDKTYSWKAHVCDMADVNSAANKTWTLVTLNGTKISVEKKPTMKFSGGKLVIFGGINRLNGSYALVNDAVIMGQLISTKMAGPPELMKLENEFAKALASVDKFHVHGTELELFSGAKVVATLHSED